MPTPQTIELLACPAWCTVDHQVQDRKIAADAERVRARTGVIPEWMARWHTHTVASLHNPMNTHSPVRVTLYRDDSLTNPDRDLVVVSLEHADCMPPELAVRVADQIREAVRIATGN